MSSRQRARLQTTILRGTCDDAGGSDEDDDGDVAVSQKKSVFLMNESVDSSDGEDTSDEEQNQRALTSSKPQIDKLVEPALKKNPQKKAPKTADQGDDWEMILNELDEEGNKFITSEILRRNNFNKLFEVDPKSLDIDTIMRKRFGGATLNDEILRGNKGAKSLPRIKVHRKLLFSAQKDDWVKPPTVIAGGFGIVKSDPPLHLVEGLNLPTKEEWFQFLWSDEYEALNSQYILVQNSGDANRLVMFLAEFPYHTEGFMQLAMVFARTGQMDRAAELVRRCIFCLECAFIESFKLASGNGCRMDPTSHENSILFTALFRHAQITCMLGCPGLAADIAKILLGLLPEGDPMLVLLALDHYMVAAGRWSQLLALTGAPANSQYWDAVASSTIMASQWQCPVTVEKSPYSVAMTWRSSAKKEEEPSTSSRVATDGHDGGEYSGNSRKAATELQGSDCEEEITRVPCAPSAVVESSAATKQGGSGGGGMVSDSSTSSGAQPACKTLKYTLEHMPNWWFSLALAAFNAERSSSSTSSASVTAGSAPSSGSAASTSMDAPVEPGLCSSILKSALARWPFMLLQLTKRAGIEGKSLAWRTVLGHSVFSAAAARYHCLS